MSVYAKEKPKYLKECFDSLLNQTVKATEWVLVKDGPLTRELEDIIQEYVLQNPNLLKIVSLERNLGLGLALAEGIRHCSNELIARMDTDDICMPFRFEKQLQVFLQYSNVDIVGSHIKEFESSPLNIIAERKVPLTNIQIRKYQKKRSAFNHMTVMYKKSAVLKAGNYQDALLMEDDLLWINMLKHGCIGKNIDDYLVYVRMGSDMIKRRGGLDYFLKYKAGRKRILKTGYISLWDYYSTVYIQLFVCLLPGRIRMLLFRYFLHT